MNLKWRKSTRCSGGTCVEMATKRVWQTASKCGGGTCVQVARETQDVFVRDSKNPHGPVLWFTKDEWSDFIAGAKAGEFDA